MHLYRYTIRAISDQLRGRFFFSYVAQMSYDFFFVYICGCHTRRGWHRPTKMYSNIPVRLFFLAERRQETINQEGEKRFKFRNQSRKKKSLERGHFLSRLQSPMQIRPGRMPTVSRRISGPWYWSHFPDERARSPSQKCATTVPLESRELSRRPSIHSI